MPSALTLRHTTCQPTRCGHLIDLRTDELQLLRRRIDAELMRRKSPTLGRQPLSSDLLAEPPAGRLTAPEVSPAGHDPSLLAKLNSLIIAIPTEQRHRTIDWVRSLHKDCTTHDALYILSCNLYRWPAPTKAKKQPSKRSSAELAALRRNTEKQLLAAGLDATSIALILKHLK